MMMMMMTQNKIRLQHKNQIHPLLKIIKISKMIEILITKSVNIWANYKQKLKVGIMKMSIAGDKISIQC